jgi:hypothetical protein
MGEATKGEIVMLILGGLNERHATWNLGTKSAFAVRTEKTTENLDIEAEARLICMNSVHTSKTTPHFTVTKIYWLMLFTPRITQSPLMYNLRATYC